MNMDGAAFSPKLRREGKAESEGALSGNLAKVLSQT